MKKLWIVNHSAIPPELGGLNRHYYFSKHLSQLGYEVKIITASAIHNTDINMIARHEALEFKERVFGGVTYTFLKTSGYRGNGLSRIINFIQFPLRLMRHFSKLDRPDVIYASTPSPFAAFAAMRIAKKLHVPVLLEVRDLWPQTLVAYGGYSINNPAIRLMYRMEKWMYRQADRLVFTFEGGADYIRDKSWDKDIDIGKIRHINNGVDLEEYNANLSAVLEDAQLDDPAVFKVVYTGSIRKAYRLDNLLETAKIVARTHPDIRFLLWGDGNEKDALMERCRTEHIDNVTFKGRIERRLVPSVLARSDVNLLHANPLGDKALSCYGCSANKLFDYFASGRPTVSNIRSGYDLITAHGCGIVSDGVSPQDLANAILAVYDMPKEEYEEVCANALRTAAEYDYCLLAQELDGIIRDVAQEHAR